MSWYEIINADVDGTGRRQWLFEVRGGTHEEPVSHEPGAPIEDLLAGTVREEWRVTGQPDVQRAYPPYLFVFGNPFEASREGTPEQRARNFIAKIAEHANWIDGPHLERRRITETDWEPVE